MKGQERLRAVKAFREYVNTAGEKVSGDQRRRIQGSLEIDYSVFRKTQAEKEILKLEKADFKRYEMRKKPRR